MSRAWDAPGEHYVWDDFPFPIELEPVTQLHNQCAFAAVTRQLEYQLRMEYAKAGTPYKIGDIPNLFDHKLWYYTMKNTYTADEKYTTWFLLQEASERRGILCSNGLFHKVNMISTVENVYKETSQKARNDSILHHLRDLRVPIIGVFEIIKSHYPIHAEVPYVAPSYFVPFETSANQKRDLHAVVIVGYYIATPHDPNDLKPGFYLIYQDSQGPGDLPSLLPKGKTILDPNLLVEAYVGATNIPSCLYSSNAHYVW